MVSKRKLQIALHRRNRAKPEETEAEKEGIRMTEEQTGFSEEEVRKARAYTKSLKEQKKPPTGETSEITEEEFKETMDKLGKEPEGYTSKQPKKDPKRYEEIEQKARAKKKEIEKDIRLKKKVWAFYNAIHVSNNGVARPIEKMLDLTYKENSWDDIEARSKELIEKEIERFRQNAKRIFMLHVMFKNNNYPLNMTLERLDEEIEKRQR